MPPVSFDVVDYVFRTYSSFFFLISRNGYLDPDVSNLPTPIFCCSPPISRHPEKRGCVYLFSPLHLMRQRFSPPLPFSRPSALTFLPPLTYGSSEFPLFAPQPAGIPCLSNVSLPPRFPAITSVWISCLFF